MSEQDRYFLIEFLKMKMGYSRAYFKKMPIKEYYLDSLGESPE
ncbi:hypothetical protein [Peribacillus butanolivorans]